MTLTPPARPLWHDLYPSGILEFLDLTQGIFETLLIKPPLLISTSDFPGGSDGKASAYDAGDPCSIPGSEGNGNPLQNTCLENPMDRGAW